MTMKRIVIGTAGHVDHGKTSLIKAMTGVDCDRLKEEKQRGLTIELGFTFLDLPSGTRVGVVDVPGQTAQTELDGRKEAIAKIAHEILSRSVEGW